MFGALAGGLGDGAPVARMGRQMVAERGGRPEHGEQPVARLAGVPQVGNQIPDMILTVDVGLAQRLHQADEPEQGKIGICHLAQCIG